MLATGLRTHTCGELRIENAGTPVVLCGWVQKARDLNGMVFVDIRDRYGITQCVVAGDDAENYAAAQKLGRECVVRVTGAVTERYNKNANRETGDIEIVVETLTVLSESKTPPFLIEDKTDALEDIRYKYRYLDIRRNPVKDALILRHKLSMKVRTVLSDLGFLEVETPVLNKSTPEGARDFVVPSRMNPGKFYALPQSPQTFKQILMVGGIDRYFQIVKCFRDEELRADRQPEFTQIDCEMSFITQEDILNCFETVVRDIFSDLVGHTFGPMLRMTYEQAMREYGIDKPDIRFEMKLVELTETIKKQNVEFKLFDESELVVAINCSGAGSLANKKIKELDKLCRSDVVGSPSGMIWVKVVNMAAGEFKSSVEKHFNGQQFAEWAQAVGAVDGDLICVMAGPKHKTRECMGKFRNVMGDRLGLREGGFAALWVVDFPLLEFDDEENRWTAMHHPFTAPKPEDIDLLATDPGAVRANAYDMVINGVEMGGGSIRIFEKPMQLRMLELLGFSKEDAEAQFGFLMSAFEYGAPPHGGLAFGLDRMCTILGGETSIRNYIAFPKNKAGRDLMIESPSELTDKQLEELYLKVVSKTSEN